MNNYDYLWLELSSEEKAVDLANDVATFTKLSKGYPDMGIPSVREFESNYFVKIPSEMDFSEYSDLIISTHEKHPADVLFESGLQENYNREDDGRKLVKELITMLDAGLGNTPQSQIAGLFKEMGWLRSMLKEGFFETAYWEHVIVFAPKNLLPTTSLEGIRLKILELAKKYNSEFDGSVS